MGLSGKMGQSRKDTRQLHEKQYQMEKRTEGDKNSIAEIKKIFDSVTQKEEKMFRGGMYDQAMAPQVSSVLG